VDASTAVFFAQPAVGLGKFNRRYVEKAYFGVYAWGVNKKRKGDTPMKNLIYNMNEKNLRNDEKVSSEVYVKTLEDRLREAMQGRQKAELTLWRLVIWCLVILSISVLVIMLYDAYVYTYYSLVALHVWFAFVVAIVFLLEKYSRVAAGYCRCEECGAEYLPTAKAWLLGAVFSMKKMYLKCPHCNKETRNKKVMVEE
jgi:hypothetical protein